MQSKLRFRLDVGGLPAFALLTLSHSSHRILNPEMVQKPVTIGMNPDGGKSWAGARVATWVHDTPFLEMLKNAGYAGLDWLVAER